MKIVHKGANYWKTFDNGDTVWPALQHSLSTHVLIIGGGMSGLLTALLLHQHNIDFVLVEAGELAGGSSSASTGLLQYSNDIMLYELRQQIGKEQADYYYRCCYDALQLLKTMIKSIEEDVGGLQYQARSSLQLSTTTEDIAKLQQEYEALSSIGLLCELWDSEQLSQHFPFSRPNALVTHQDAEINPHLFVIKSAQFLMKHGQQLYEHSAVTGLSKLNSGRYRADINGVAIDAATVVHAVGYQYQQLQQLQLQLLLARSYVIVTEPIENLDFWYERMLIWETARPYFYTRITDDNRIIIGGLDEPTSDVNWDQASVSEHSEKLLSYLQQLFPELDTRIAYQWNATFIETRDGLPYIGAHPQDPTQYFVLGYGGNGVVSSMLGAQYVADAIIGQQSLQPLGTILGLAR